MFEENIGKIKEQERQLGKEMRERLITYIIAAFGLVASLAWNEAVKSLIDYFFPASANTIFAKFLYAVSITVIVVIIAVYLERILRRGKEND